MNQLEKENKFLKLELEGRISPKKEKSKVEITHEEWRQGFLKRYKKEVLNKD